MRKKGGCCPERLVYAQRGQSLHGQAGSRAGNSASVREAQGVRGKGRPMRKWAGERRKGLPIARMYQPLRKKVGVRVEMSAVA